LLAKSLPATALRKFQELIGAVFSQQGVTGVAAAPLARPCCPAAIARSVPTHRLRRDAQSNFGPTMQSVCDLNKLEDA